jgi:hypothetical protein
MSQAIFITELVAELRLRGVPHDRAQVAEFVEDAWPLIDSDPLGRGRSPSKPPVPGYATYG